jgi:hypothetical protein
MQREFDLAKGESINLLNFLNFCEETVGNLRGLINYRLFKNDRACMKEIKEKAYIKSKCK